MKRILIVDSDKEVRALIAKYARLEGYDATEAIDYDTTMMMCHQNPYDLIVMEALVPGMDMFSMLRAIRTFSLQLPVIILSSRCSEADRIRGFELGADDYMAKPFSPKELMLRIAVLLRRSICQDQLLPQTIRSGGLVIEMAARRALVDGKEISLTPKEFDLLTLLASRPSVVFARKQLLDIIWGGELPQDTRTLDTHIKQIRRAIAPYGDRIITLRGVGYRFE